MFAAHGGCILSAATDPLRSSLVLVRSPDRTPLPSHRYNRANDRAVRGARYTIREMDLGDGDNFLGRSDLWEQAQADGLWSPGDPKVEQASACRRSTEL